MTDRPPDESPLIPFLRLGRPPDRTRSDGWQRFRQIRGTFIPAPRKSMREFANMSPRGKALHNLHRTATHVNLRLLGTPMSAKVAAMMKSRLQNNAMRFMPGAFDGLMINGGGFQGKTETACDAAAEFEDLWRELLGQLLPEGIPGTRDEFVPAAYCKTPVRATPKAMCAAILNVYGDPVPKTLDDRIKAMREALADHNTTALLIDDITRLRLHREDDEDTLDLIRELMDMTVTIVLIGVDIPRSGILRGAYFDMRAKQWVFPDVRKGKSHNPGSSAHVERRFDMIDLDPFDYTTPEGIATFVEHLVQQQFGGPWKKQ